MHFTPLLLAACVALSALAAPLPAGKLELNDAAGHHHAASIHQILPSSDHLSPPHVNAPVFDELSAPQQRDESSHDPPPIDHSVEMIPRSTNPLAVVSQVNPFSQNPTPQVAPLINQIPKPQVVPQINRISRISNPQAVPQINRISQSNPKSAGSAAGQPAQPKPKRPSSAANQGKKPKPKPQPKPVPSVADIKQNLQVDPDQSLFYSGSNGFMSPARQRANKMGEKILDMAWTDRTMPQSTKAYGKAGTKKFWDNASQAFAELSSGTVHVLLEDNVDASNFGTTSVWARIEWPTLQKNPLVTKVVKVTKAGAETTLLDRTNPSAP